MKQLPNEKKNKNVFFVGSPLQMLCAIEACDAFDIPYANRVLVVYQCGYSAEDLFATIKLWNRDFWWDSHFLNQTRQFYSLNYLIQSQHIVSLYQGRVDRVFIAHERKLMQYFIGKTLPNSVWLYDDGSISLEIAKERTTASLDSSSGIMSSILGMCGVKIDRIKTLNYFSTFAVQPLAHEKLVKNSFSVLKSKINEGKGIENTVMFLGGPLVEDGFISEVDFTSLIQKVAANYEKMIYVPHRKESKSRLTRLEKIDIHLSSYPIEVELSMLKVRPLVVASFFSSALFTLPQIYGEVFEYVAYEIKEEMYLMPEEVDTYRNIYASLRESAHVNVIGWDQYEANSKN